MRSSCFAAIAVIGLLAGCAQLSTLMPPTTTSAPQSAADIVSAVATVDLTAIATVDEAKVALTTFNQLGIAYIGFPVCKAGGPVFCSDPAAVAAIKSIGAQAKVDIDKAAAGTETLAQAITSLKAFATALAQLK
jgi:hypothetical protein